MDEQTSLIEMSESKIEQLPFDAAINGEIILAPPPDIVLPDASPSYWAPSGEGKTLNANILMIQNDLRLSAIAQIASQGKFLNTTTRFEDKFADYGLIFSKLGLLIARIDSSSGIFQIPADIPINLIQHNERRGSDESLAIIKKYAEMLSVSEPPFIEVMGKKTDTDIFYMQHGNHRLEAARLAHRNTIKGWVNLVRKDGNLYRVLRGADEPSEGINRSVRFMQAVQKLSNI